MQAKIKWDWYFTNLLPKITLGSNAASNVSDSSGFIVTLTALALSASLPSPSSPGGITATYPDTISSAADAPGTVSTGFLVGTLAPGIGVCIAVTLVPDGPDRCLWRPAVDGSSCGCGVALPPCTPMLTWLGLRTAEQRPVASLTLTRLGFGTAGATPVPTWLGLRTAEERPVVSTTQAWLGLGAAVATPVPTWLGLRTAGRRPGFSLTPTWLGLWPVECPLLGGRPGASSPDTSRRIDSRAMSFAPTSAALSLLLFFSCFGEHLI